MTASVSLIAALLLAAPAAGAKSQDACVETLIVQRCCGFVHPRIVVLGSSTAAGVGASSPAMSWVGRLAEAIAPRGFAVVNRSISGSTTRDSIARFNVDAAAWNPAFVVLATSIVNEGLTDNDIPKIVPQYLANTRQLIRMVEDIGAIPIVVSPYPNGAFTPRIRAALVQLSSDLEAEGVAVWDFLSAVDDGQGKWLPGLSADGTHPTDTGHALLFGSIPVSFFEAATRRAALAPAGRYGAWQSNGPDAALSVSAFAPAPSWTVAFWLKPDASPGAHALVAAGDLSLELSAFPANTISLSVAGQRILSAPAPKTGVFSHLAVTYRRATGALRLYVNGAPAGEAIVGARDPAALFRFGGDPNAVAKSSAFAQILIYRTPLPPEDIADLYAARIHTKSLEADLPLAQSPARRSINRALTLPDELVTGPWLWTADGPR